MKRSVLARALALAVVLPAAGCVSLTPYEDLISAVPAEQFLTVEGRRVHLVDRGEGPAVLLVHGFGSSAYSWREVISELEGEYRLLAVDLYGFGLTERPRSKQAYGRYSQGELLLAVLDTLEVDQAHLVGHSYGGSISVALALREPERFTSLTLVNSAAPEYPQIRRSRWASVRPLTYLLARSLYLRRDNIAASLKRSIEDDRLVSDELVDEYWRRLAVAGSPRAFWGLTAPLDDPQGEIEVTDLALPTLLLWGEEDTLIPAAGAERVAGEMPAGRYVGLPGAGHAPMEEQPAELATALRSFFASRR